jgi:Fic family protein
MSNTNNNSTDMNLFTTMAIFVSKAPKLIGYIEQAVEVENMEALEDHAAQLIVYSDNARLEGFTQRIKNLIIAARENKIHTAKEHANDIKQSFEKMTKPAEITV